MVDTALDVFRSRQETGHSTVVVFYRGERSFFCRQWLKRWLSIPAMERRFDLADVFLLFVSSQSQGKAYSVADQFVGQPSLIDRRVFFYGDPEHLLVNYLTESAISRPVITNPESHRAHGWVFDFGMVQPAIVAVGAESAILYEWTTKPSLRNVAGKLDRPDPWDVWDRIERRLDRIRITKARAARKTLAAAPEATSAAAPDTSIAAASAIASVGVTSHASNGSLRLQRTAAETEITPATPQLAPEEAAAQVTDIGEAEKREEESPSRSFENEQPIDVRELATIPPVVQKNAAETVPVQFARAAVYPPVPAHLSPPRPAATPRLAPVVIDAPAPTPLAEQAAMDSVPVDAIAPDVIADDISRQEAAVTSAVAATAMSKEVVDEVTTPSSALENPSQQQDAEEETAEEIVEVTADAQRKHDEREGPPNAASDASERTTLQSRYEDAEDAIGERTTHLTSELSVKDAADNVGVVSLPEADDFASPYGDDGTDSEAEPAALRHIENTEAGMSESNITDAVPSTESAKMDVEPHLVQDTITDKGTAEVESEIIGITETEEERVIVVTLPEERAGVVQEKPVSDNEKYAGESQVDAEVVTDSVVTPTMGELASNQDADVICDAAQDTEVQVEVHEVVTDTQMTSGATMTAAMEKRSVTAAEPTQTADDMKDSDDDESEDLEPQADELTEAGYSQSEERHETASRAFTQPLSSGSFDIQPSTSENIDASVTSVGSDQVETSMPMAKHESVRTEDSSQVNTLTFDHGALMIERRIIQEEADDRRVETPDYLKEMKDPAKNGVAKGDSERGSQSAVVMSEATTSSGTQRSSTQAGLQSAMADNDANEAGKAQTERSEVPVGNSTVAGTVSPFDPKFSDRLSAEDEGNTLMPETILVPATDSPHPEVTTVPRTPIYDMSPFTDAEHELLHGGDPFGGVDTAASRRDEYEAYDEYIVCEYEVEEYVEEYESDTLSKSRIYMNVAVEEELQREASGSAVRAKSGSRAAMRGPAVAVLDVKGAVEGGEGAFRVWKEENGEGATTGASAESRDGDGAAGGAIGSVRNALRKIAVPGRQKRTGNMDERDVERVDGEAAMAAAEKETAKVSRKDTFKSVLRKLPAHKGSETEAIRAATAAAAEEAARTVPSVTAEDGDHTAKLGRKETLKSVLRKIPVPKNLKRQHTISGGAESVQPPTRAATAPLPIDGGGAETVSRARSRHLSLPRSPRGERDVAEIDGDDGGRVGRKDTLRAALRGLPFGARLAETEVGGEGARLSGGASMSDGGSAFSSAVDGGAEARKREGVGARMLKRLSGSHDGVAARRHMLGADGENGNSFLSGGTGESRRQPDVEVVIGESVTDGASTPGARADRHSEAPDGGEAGGDDLAASAHARRSKFRRTLSRLRHSAIRHSETGATEEEEGEEGTRRRRKGGGSESPREEEGEKVSGKMSFAVVGEKILSRFKQGVGA